MPLVIKNIRAVENIIESLQLLTHKTGIRRMPEQKVPDKKYLLSSDEGKNVSKLESDITYKQWLDITNYICLSSLQFWGTSTSFLCQFNFYFAAF